MLPIRIQNEKVKPATSETPAPCESKSSKSLFSEFFWICYSLFSFLVSLGIDVVKAKPHAHLFAPLYQ